MKDNFVAIDFETSYGHIPCSIGIVEFINGEITNKYYSLIKPIELKFNPINSSINGIKLEHVINEREFNLVWIEIEKYINNRTIVAHNSTTDISILIKTLNHYNIPIPEFRDFCTLKMAKSIFSNLDIQLKNFKLSTLANYYKITQNNYHNALDDAIVCGNLFQNIWDKYKQHESSNFYSFKKTDIVVKNPFSLKIENNLQKKEVVLQSENLSGKTFIISGVFENYSREQLKDIIEANGGKILSSISAKLNYLVAGDNMGPAKLEKANKLQIPIITEQDLIALLQ